MPKLAIDIEARFAQAMDALDSLGRKADQQSKAMQTAFRGVGAVLGAALGSGALLAVGQIADSIAAYKQLSEQMGDSAEAVSALQRASDISGVSLDEVSRASARLTSTLAKGGQEAKDSAEALGAIGISFEEFKRLSPVDQLEKVALQLAKFEDGAGKTAVAMQLFGRAGAQLLPFFNDLADAGGRTARLTEEQIRAADEYTKSVARLKSEFSGLVQSLTADVIPSFAKVLETLNRIRETSFTGFFLSSGAQEKNAGAEIERINDSLAKLKRTRDELDPSKGIGNKLNDIIFGDVGDLNRQIALLEKQRTYLKSVQAAQALAEQVPDERRFQGDPKGTLNFALKEDEKKPKAAKTARETEAEKLTDWLEKQSQAMQEFNILEQTAVKIAEARDKKEHGITDAIEEQLLAKARLVDADKARKKQEEETAAFEAFMSQLLADQDAKARSLADSYRNLADGSAEFRKQLEEIAELQAAGVLSAEDADEASRRIVERLKGFDEEKEKIEELDEFTKQSARNMQDAFAEFLFDPFEDRLDGLLDKFGEIVRKMIAEALAAQLMNKLLGDYSKTGTVGGIIGALASASGGSGGGGENLRGIEGGSDAVYGSAVATKSGGSVYQTINVNSGGGQDASTDQIRRAVKQAALAAVSESRMRNGQT